MSRQNRRRSVAGVVAAVVMLGAGTASAATKAVGWGPSTAYVTANQAVTGGTLGRSNATSIVGGPDIDDFWFKPYSESTALNPAIGANYVDQGNARYYGGVGYLYWDSGFGSTMWNGTYNGVADGGAGNDSIRNSGRQSSVNNAMHLAIIWMKADFMNGLNALSALQLDSASTLTLVATQSGAVPIRFLVKNGSSYYVSQSTMTANGTLTVADPTTEQWAQLTMTGGNSTMWAWTIGTFGTVSFNDIQGIGYYASGKPATAIAPIWSVTEFSAYVLDPRPTVTVTASDSAAAEATPATETGTFTVSRGSRTDGALVVNYTLPVSGTATPGSSGGDYTTTPAADYAARTGSVTIADGSSSATVTVTPEDDGTTETSETVDLTLASSSAYFVGSPSSATVNIADNDAGNVAPVVSAGSDKSVVSNALPASTGLDGSATDADSGPSPMTYQWAKVSGLGGVTFGDATVTNTTATFDTAGAYVLSLSAYDGADTRSNTVTITVYDNEAPAVNAGSDQTITLATTAVLDGALSPDDGQPASPAIMYAWSKDSGVGTATFGNSALIDTTVTFDQTGVYVLKLTATDGLGLFGSDTVTITVRDSVTFTAIANGAFNAAGTWDAPGDVSGPPLAGDTAYVTNWTVTATNAGEVAAGLTVFLSGGISSTGTLAIGQGLAFNVNGIAANGATINVSTGGTLYVNRSIITPNVNLNGGMLHLVNQNASVGSATTPSTNSISSASLIRVDGSTSTEPSFGKGATVWTGSGSLTVTGAGILQQAAVSGASTWNGSWDIQGSARLWGDTVLPGDIRVAVGGTVTHNGAYTIRGTRSGFGTIALYQNNILNIGDGSTNSPGRGWLSPGDVDVSNGVGDMTLTCTTTDYGPHLRFASNSTYVVDIAGTTSDLYDRVAAVGVGTGAGNVQIVTGAILTVNLWAPSGYTVLNAKIIDTATGTGGEGMLTGMFSATNWLNSAGWHGLAAVVVGNDLYVTGYTGARGTTIIFQ